MNVANTLRSPGSVSLCPLLPNAVSPIVLRLATKLPFATRCSTRRLAPGEILGPNKTTTATAVALTERSTAQ